MASVRINPDVLNFLRRADRMLTQAAEEGTEEEEAGRAAHIRADVVSTVVEQLKGQETHCARHVFGSVALARVLRAATDAQRARVVAPLLRRGDPYALLSDKYASHVLEEIVALAAQPESMVDSQGGLAQVLVEFVERLVEPPAAGPTPLVASMRDRHGTYAVRALFRVLSGRPFVPRGSAHAAKNELQSTGPTGTSSAADPAGQDTPRVTVPLAFGDALQRVAEAVLSHGRGTGEGVRQLFSHTVASPALLELVESLPETSKQLDALISALLKWPAEDEPSVRQLKDSGGARGNARTGAGLRQERLADPQPPPETVEWVRSLARESSGSRALEAILKAAPSKWWDRVYVVARGSLLEMASHSLANFVVQTLAMRASNKRQLQRLLGEICPGMSSLLASRAGVVWRLAQSCARLGCGGAALLEAFSAACPPSGQKCRRQVDGEERESDGGALARLILAIGAHGGKGQAWVGQGGGGRGGREQGRGSHAPGQHSALAPSDKPAHARDLVVSNLGSRTFEALLSLRFDESSAALLSLSNLPPEELLDLSRHPVGSRTVEAALATPGPGAAEARQPILDTLCSSPGKLIRSRAGCFVLGATFDAVPTHLQEKILSGLLASETDLRATNHGSSLLRRLRFEHYKSHPDSWASMQVRDSTCWLACPRRGALLVAVAQPPGHHHPRVSVVVTAHRLVCSASAMPSHRCLGTTLSVDAPIRKVAARGRDRAKRRGSAPTMGWAPL